jgi:primosomal protein N'
LQFSKPYGGLYKNFPPAFTPQELYDMRPGGCFRVDFADIEHRSGSVLASIVPQFQHDSSQAPNVTLMVYQSDALPPKLDQHLDDASILWTISPIGSLISHVRQFEACTRATKVAFLPSILCPKQSTHVRFHDSDDDDDDDDDEDKPEEPENDFSANNPNNTPISGSPSASPTTTLTTLDQTPNEPCEKTPRVVVTPTTLFSKLNATQQKAAKRFLESDESTLTLVQGPPGTGKTTFLSSVIYENWICERRMLVSAPTNKAIGVVCSRFLQLLLQ